tara:strand:- start:73 stop:267 length:195 start_codon:yes stop_codon:yes gene_type:complete
MSLTGLQKQKVAMIKFFRNIRRKLLSEGKTINSLKYAIGKIVIEITGDTILCPFRDDILVEIKN